MIYQFYRNKSLHSTCMTLYDLELWHRGDEPASWESAVAGEDHLGDRWARQIRRQIWWSTTCHRGHATHALQVPDIKKSLKRVSSLRKKCWRFNLYQKVWGYIWPYQEFKVSLYMWNFFPCIKLIFLCILFRTLRYHNFVCLKLIWKLISEHQNWWHCLCTDDIASI